jgi:quercetin dioxygenase-like cupin family protein
MFYRASDDGYQQSRPGVARKTLVWGEQALLAEYHLKKGTVLANHQHPEEQVGYLLSGQVLFHINGESFPAYPGDSWAIPGGVEHSVDIIQDSVAIEVFSPVRQEYIP